MGMYLATLLTVLLAAAHTQASIPTTASASASPHGISFNALGNRAMTTLTHVYYTGHGQYRACDASGCPVANLDWGDDSLTYAMALREAATHNSTLISDFKALTRTALTYPAPCRQASSCPSFSDRPSWDAVADVEEYMATSDQTALAKSEAAFNFVANSHVFALGACPSILYQKAGGGATRVKTLETQANLIKAAILLYQATQNSSYLSSAISNYNAVRSYYLDSQVPLYSVYVFDDGHSCSQLPHRFFASVNGDMIWSGAQLAQITGDSTYLNQAIDTAQAVSTELNDARGVFADLQAENDVVEPLVEGMLVLANRGQNFAQQWILKNAAAAASARTADGSYGRFFDGPRPPGTVTIWQTNGGLALEIAAASIDPGGTAGNTHAWRGAKHVSRQIGNLPAAITFRGSGIAVFGTLGEQCCSSGHARVFIDGHETEDQTGIWQNKANFHQSFPDTIMFAWRWPKVGRHRIRFLPGLFDAKEGGSFLHLDSYEVLP